MRKTVGLGFSCWDSISGYRRNTLIQRGIPHPVIEPAQISQCTSTDRSITNRQVDWRRRRYRWVRVVNNRDGTGGGQTEVLVVQNDRIGGLQTADVNLNGTVERKRRLFKGDIRPYFQVVMNWNNVAWQTTVDGVILVVVCIVYICVVTDRVYNNTCRVIIIKKFLGSVRPINSIWHLQ